jgi:4-hydroxythreonine-4-phosphate dehydrogenase
VRKPLIAITVGDCNGIGPEVTLKTVTRRSILAICTPVLVGPAVVFEYYARLFRIGLRLEEWKGLRTASKRGLWIVESSQLDADAIKPGQLSHLAGHAAGEAITSAAKLALGGFVDAMVTAPVSKQALHLAGVKAPGQTEWLQQLTHSHEVAMMLAGPHMRIGLVTIHEPLVRVPAVLTTELIVRQTRIVHDALTRDWGIAKPRIALLGLNPHAGEGGDIGTEEARRILPAIERLRRKHIDVEGPFPADGFFARYRPGVYDGVMAMYHDQGLIPLKMSSGNRAVNVSVGLRIVRTSPDHGTAFALAGTGTADSTSMQEAMRLSVTIAANRRRSLRRRSHR